MRVVNVETRKLQGLQFIKQVVLPVSYKSAEKIQNLTYEPGVVLPLPLLLMIGRFV